MLLLYYLFAVTILAKISRCENATIEVWLTKSGLEFLNEVGENIVANKLNGSKLPDISLPVQAGIGYGVINTNNVQIYNLILPTFQFKITEPNELTWKTDGGIIQIYMHGSVEATAEDIRINMANNLSLSDHHPQIFNKFCQISVMEFQIHIGGGVIPWIINLFENEIAEAIKQTIDQQLCKTVTSVLMVRVNEVLIKLSSRLKISQNIYLNYVFTNLTVEDEFLKSAVQGNIVYGNGTCPLVPSAMSTEVSSDVRMLYFWFSDHVPNCLFHSLFQEGLFSVTITNDTLHGTFSKFLRTNCSTQEILCIGNILPTLKKSYPNESLDFKVQAETVPVLHTATDGIVAQANVGSGLYISPLQQQNSSLLQLEMNVTANITPLLSDKKLSGKLNDLKIKITDFDSHIGDFSEKTVQFLERLLNLGLEAVLRRLFNTGVPLPLFFNVSFSDVELSTNDGYSQINTNFQIV
uniref:BPI1 domain-containing protein n=1 Tax=Syphacia muris TaxID=451379 RepID=A0A0N5ARQ7_9BILA